MIFSIFLYNFLAMIFSIIMVYAKSPVRSVLSLILTFTFVTLMFLNLNVHFSSLVLLLVYLGAVIVMFLILVMFINIRIYKTSYLEILNYKIFLTIILCFALLFTSSNSIHLGLSLYYIKWFNIASNFGILQSLCLQVFGLFSVELCSTVILLLLSMIASMAIVFIETENIWNYERRK